LSLLLRGYVGQQASRVRLEQPFYPPKHVHAGVWGGGCSKGLNDTQRIDRGLPYAGPQPLSSAGQGEQFRAERAEPSIDARQRQQQGRRRRKPAQCRRPVQLDRSWPAICVIGRLLWWRWSPVSYVYVYIWVWVRMFLVPLTVRTTDAGLPLLSGPRPFLAASGKRIR
jgi:hypothetical protein